MTSVSISSAKPLLRGLWRSAKLAAMLGASAALLACGGGGGAPLDRGPTTFTTAADINGVLWDASESRLFVTDDNTNAILTWDGDGKTTFTNFVNLPALVPPATPTQVSIGEMARTANKTFYVTRFGFGNAGTVVEVSPSRVVRNLTGLDAARRRIGATVTAGGEIIDNWFVAPPSPNASTTNGGVSLLTVTAGGAASERELVTGLSKPTGTVVVGRTLYVTDQATGRLLSYPLDAVLSAPRTAAQGTTVATFTANLVSSDPGALTADNLDLMTAGPDGTLYFGGRGGKLYRVSPAGVVTLIENINTAADPGRLQIRGVSVDATNRRLFVAVHSTDLARAPNSLRIYPL